MRSALRLAAVLALCSTVAFAQSSPPGTGNMTPNSSGGGSPSGAAGGLLSGTYPNPGLNLGQLSNYLASDVALSASGTYFDGPSITQGTTGTWSASGSVVITDTAAGGAFFCKLWDGTNVIAAGAGNPSGAGVRITISLSGQITSPAGNIRISCADEADTTGSIRSNSTSQSTTRDSSVSAFRIQ
jgi:hypothetical protein